MIGFSNHEPLFTISSVSARLVLRVLILTQYYSPEPSLRPAELAPRLQRRGHKVTVITGFPSYPYGEVYKGYRLRPWQWETVDGVRVLRLFLLPDHSHSAWRRALYFLSLSISASVLGLLLCGGGEVMYVYNDPSLGIPAALIKLLRRVPFVFEVADIWPESLAATGMMKSRWLLAQVDRLVRLATTQASAVTAVSPGFMARLIQKGVPKEHLHYIPNWAEDEVYRPSPPNVAFAQSIGLAGRFNVVYAGNMGYAQALHTVIEAAESLQDLPTLQFVFVGDGIEKPGLQELTREKQLSNVCFLDRQPPERMPQIYALADVLLAHLKSDPLFDITIPSKTLAYLASGKPVLMAVAGDAADVVRDANAGLTCPPEDPRALAVSIRRLYLMSENERAQLGSNGREAFLRLYSADVLIERWEKLLQASARRSHRVARAHLGGE